MRVNHEKTACGRFLTSRCPGKNRRDRKSLLFYLLDEKGLFPLFVACVLTGENRDYFIPAYWIWRVGRPYFSLECGDRQCRQWRKIRRRVSRIPCPYCIRPYIINRLQWRCGVWSVSGNSCLWLRCRWSSCRCRSSSPLRYFSYVFSSLSMSDCSSAYFGRCYSSTWLDLSFLLK